MTNQKNESTKRIEELIAEWVGNRDKYEEDTPPYIYCNGIVDGLKTALFNL